MKSIHMGISVSADRFSDAYIRKRILPAVTVGGRPITIEQFRIMCGDARAKGYKVVPPCDKVNELGFCIGHEDAEQSPEVTPPTR